MGYRALSKYRSELMGLAMLWVMCFHAFDLDLGREWLNNLRSDGFGGVDVFILLSSVGLVMSLERREREYGAFLRRRAARILPAYYAVMLPFTAYLIVKDGIPSTALLWNSTLLNYWVRCKGSFNWYVSGAMIFYALTPMCWRFLRKRQNRGAWTLLGCALGLLVCQWLMQVGYWQYMDLFYRVPIFFLGLLIGLYCAEDRKLTRRSAALWALCFAFGAAYIAFVRRKIDTSPVYVMLCHAFVFTTVPGCLGCCLLFEKLPLEWLRRPLRLIGENSLEIYLLNVSVFSRYAEFHAYTFFGPSHRLYFLLQFIVNIALGCLLHRAMETLKKRRSHT